MNYKYRKSEGRIQVIVVIMMILQGIESISKIYQGIQLLNTDSVYSDSELGWKLLIRIFIETVIVMTLLTLEFKKPRLIKAILILLGVITLGYVDVNVINNLALNWRLQNFGLLLFLLAILLVVFQLWHSRLEKIYNYR